MALLCSRNIFQTCRRTFFLSTSIRGNNFPHAQFMLYSTRMFTILASELPDPLEHATGLEKKELLAAAAGNFDPYYMKAIQIAQDSTKDKPNLVPSVFNSRIVGCVCEEDATHVNWMWLHQGAPRRCECGHWFKLIQKAPL